ncbi:DoxX family protein [Streptomyces oryzae]|uniref:DoxX family protein n=1 Tax=Streptomyces oryzae TaxID=1434886 RepID=A0ABS3X8S2_9ACTN|nr:DoxX family protein [Streptomyces oryzae]MBO8191774.1 DoxX family protein [Streptomyces oryzae]
MRITVWIISALLALVFLAAGGLKIVGSAADLEAMGEGIPTALFRVAGVAEVLGALGLILPAATRVLPRLTPLAASGLTLTMVGATVANLAIGAYAVVPQTLLFGALSAFVAWARFGTCAIDPRPQATLPLS